MIAPHFEQVSLFLIGNVLDVPGRLVSRLLSGGFHGFSQTRKSRLEAKPLLPADETQIPTSLFGPLTTLIVAESYRLEKDDPRST
jgi:hypothetical protein